MNKHCKTLYSFLKSFTPHLVFVVVNILASVIGSLLFEWRTGLTSLFLIPLIMLSQAVQLAFIQGISESRKEIHSDSSRLIGESVTNIRTVLSLNCQLELVNIYSNKLAAVEREIINKCWISGLIYGFSYLLQFVGFALIFFFAALFISAFSLDFEDCLASIFLVIFAGITAGNHTNFMPDLSEAKISASALFQIMSMEDEYQR